MERLHPVDEHQVIREIIPGGDEPRTLRLYPNQASVRIVQWLEGKRFVPNFIVTLVDDSRPLPESFLTDEVAGQVEAEEFSNAA